MAGEGWGAGKSATQGVTMEKVFGKKVTPD